MTFNEHENNTHRRKSLTKIKLEVTPKCSLNKKGCVTEATKLQKMERHNKLQIKPLLASMLQQGEGREGKLNCCGRRDVYTMVLWRERNGS